MYIYMILYIYIYEYYMQIDDRWSKLWCWFCCDPLWFLDGLGSDFHLWKPRLSPTCGAINIINARLASGIGIIHAAGESNLWWCHLLVLSTPLNKGTERNVNRGIIANFLDNEKTRVVFSFECKPYSKPNYYPFRGIVLHICKSGCL